MKLYRATLTGIKAVESEWDISEHVESGTWEAWGRTAQRAKQLLVSALEKRVFGAETALNNARSKLSLAEALKVPQ